MEAISVSSVKDYKWEKVPDVVWNTTMWDRARIYAKAKIHKTELEAWQCEFRCWLRFELQKLLKELNERHER